jgi:ribonuclease HI
MPKEQTAHQLIIYTDGAARGNPGKGGYGVVLLWGDKRKELSGATGIQRITAWS